MKTSITEGQKKQYFRFVEDAAERALKETGLDKDGLQKLIENGIYIMESVYHLYNDVYPHFIKDVPVPVDGHVTAPEAPGLGVELREEALRNGDAVIETIAEL